MLCKKGTMLTDFSSDNDEIIDTSDSSKGSFSTHAERDNRICCATVITANDTFKRPDSAQAKSVNFTGRLSHTPNVAAGSRRKRSGEKKRAEIKSSAPFTICGFSGTFTAVPKKPSLKDIRDEKRLRGADLVREVITEGTNNGKGGKSCDGKSSPKTLAEMWKVTEEQLTKKRIQRTIKQLVEMGFTKESVSKVLMENPGCTSVEDAVQLLASSLPPPQLSVPATTVSLEMSNSVLDKKKSPPSSPTKKSPLKPQLVPQKNFEREMETAAKELRTLSGVPLVLSEGSGDSERVVLDPSISSKLMDFQRDGVKFLYNLYKNDRGGILADGIQIFFKKKLLIISYILFFLIVLVICRHGAGKDSSNNCIHFSCAW